MKIEYLEKPTRVRIWFNAVQEYDELICVHENEELLTLTQGLNDCSEPIWIRTGAINPNAIRRIEYLGKATFEEEPEDRQN